MPVFLFEPGNSGQTVNLFAPIRLFTSQISGSLYWYWFFLEQSGFFFFFNLVSVSTQVCLLPAVGETWLVSVCDRITPQLVGTLQQSENDKGSPGQTLPGTCRKVHVRWGGWQRLLGGARGMDCKSPFAEAGVVSVGCVTLAGGSLGLSKSPQLLWVEEGASATKDPLVVLRRKRFCLAFDSILWLESHFNPPPHPDPV